MSQHEIDVTGIGNAIVDVLTHTDESFLVEQGLDKGAMRLIDAEQAQQLYWKMGQCIEVSGGSAGNTMAGIASLGGKGGYIGKVSSDQLGEVFAHDLRAVGIEYDTPPSTDGAPTARCLILVTPDAQRTMNTFLGACVELGPEDVDPELIRRSKITYLEGYLWDPPGAKDAFVKAARLAHENGRKVSLSLSDKFCVDRHRDSFLDLVHNHVDVLFANETEILSLYQTDDFDEAVRRVRGHCEVAALTRSAKGAVIVHQEDALEMPAEPIDRVVDTTGAGDLYAAGFLHGYARGYPLAQCARMGAICAAEVISHDGARPESSLRKLVDAKLDQVA
jgi:sugar/nucleoside kinase (ribokinase family)